jgi:ureidoacrylate peracid hydrolase
VDGLAPRPDETIVVKWTFGGFHGTELDTLLRDRGINTLLFTGCTTSVCVETTLREAMSRLYNCVLLEDCVAEPVGANQARTNHDATVLVTELVLGWVTNSTDVVATLSHAHQMSEQAAVEPA